MKYSIGNPDAYDRAGVVLSVICAIHCAGVSLVAVFFPLIASGSGGSHFHEFLAAVLLLIALLSLGRGYLRHHRGIVVVLGAAGMATLLFGVFVGHEGGGVLLESLITVPGSAMLILAHLINIRHLSCKCCASERKKSANCAVEGPPQTETEGLSRELVSGL